MAMTATTLEKRATELVDLIENMDEAYEVARIEAPPEKPMMLYFYTGEYYPERE